MEITVSGAYGRDYKSKKAMLEDWNAGKDFRMRPSGQYCSTRDFPTGTVIRMRYKQDREVFIHKQK